MSKSTEEWRALLDTACPGNWELGDSYDDGPRQILGEGAIIGTIAMHDTRMEHLIAAAPEAVTEVVRLRRALEAWRDDMELSGRVDSKLAQFSTAPFVAVMNQHAEKINRILEDSNE